MTFETMIGRLIEETTQRSLGHFAPELALCVTIVGMLLMRMSGKRQSVPSFWIAMIGSFAALVMAAIQVQSMSGFGSENPEIFFSGLLVFDRFGVFFRFFLLLFLMFVVALTVLSGIPDNEDGADFYTLLFGSTIGMMLMVSANHLLILFLGIEMTSVPSYVMVGFLKGRRKSSEAALKYVVYGAGAAGVMLYGISLLAGLLGTADMTQIAAHLETLVGTSATMGDANIRTVVLAMLMVFVGIAFKLSLFPFHFWCPDAFEGASAEVAGFLSVASKAAAFALLVRFCLAFVGGDVTTLGNVHVALGIGLGVIAAVTVTFGNLAAYAQTNIKRLLAYSTIAHAGYMLMAVAAMMVILSPSDAFDNPQAAAVRCLEGLLFYLAVYFFMNLGAFAIVALIRNKIFSEEIDDYRGLASQTPTLCICMAVCLFSLLGMPPLGGFIGKWMIFWGLFQAGSVHWSMWALLVIAGANTVFSLFYYVRVLKAMFLDARPEGARDANIPLMSNAGAYVLLVSLPVLLLGTFGIRAVSEWANSVASVLF